MKFIKKIGKLFVGFGVLFVLFNMGMYVYCLITPKIQISRNQSYYLLDNKNKYLYKIEMSDK